MAELAPERRALKAALDALKVDAWVFEQDAGARPESIQKALIELRRRWTKPISSILPDFSDSLIELSRGSLGR